MPEITLILDGRPTRCCLYFTTYNSTANDAVELLTWNDEDEDGGYWESYARLSINTDYRLMEGEFIVNHDVADRMPVLVEAGLFEETGRTYSYGYVQDAKVYRILDKARELAWKAEEEAA